MIMDMIQSGDIVFIRKDCSQSFSPSNMLRCYKQQMQIGSELDYDTVAFVVRQGPFLKVISDHEGELSVQGYPEFVSLPIFEELMVRRLEIETEDPNFRSLFNKRMVLLLLEIENSVFDLKRFEDDSDPEESFYSKLSDVEPVNDLKTTKFFEQNSQSDHSQVISWMASQGAFKNIYKYRKFDKKRKAIDIMIKEMGMLHPGVEDEVESEDMNFSRPPMLQSIYNYSHRTVVRSETNNGLIMSELLK